jgi:hypothetical protein
MFTKKHTARAMDAQSLQAFKTFTAILPLISLEQEIMHNQNSRKEFWRQKIEELNCDLERTRYLILVAQVENLSPKEINAVIVTNRHLCGQLSIVLCNEKIRNIFQERANQLPKNSQELLKSLISMALKPKEEPRVVIESKV